MQIRSPLQSRSLLHPSSARAAMQMTIPPKIPPMMLFMMSSSRENHDSNQSRLEASASAVAICAATCAFFSSRWRLAARVLPAVASHNDRSRNLPGREVTPLLLGALSDATAGRSRAAHLHRLEQNAHVAAATARAHALPSTP